MGDFGKYLAGAVPLLPALLAFAGVAGAELGMLLGWWLA